MLTVLLLLVHGIGEHGMNSKGRRGARRQSSGSLHRDAKLNAGAGADYRLELADGSETRYLYNLNGVVVANRVFFSLFRMHTVDGDDSSARLLSDHAGGSWLMLSGSGGSYADAARLVLSAVGTNRSLAQRFWTAAAPQHSAGCYTFFLDAARTRAIGRDARDPMALTSVAAAATEVAVLRVQPVLSSRGVRRGGSRAAGSHASSTDDLKHSGPSTFARRVQRSVTRMHGREFVLVTYHNVGMLDWAVLFWKWLHRAGLRRFLLLELDGLTCDAARALNCSLHFECATGRDMAMLPKAMTEIRDASSMQEWGTDATSGYFKFLRWKMCVVELLLRQGVDALMADVDVLVLNNGFFETLAASPHDLTISSDARRGRYNDNPHCPCSHPMYQRYSADWVCAGLFYMRSTPASRWFMREVQGLMDAYVITDQDAIQAVLTGHTQVAVPQMRVNATAEREAGHRVEAIAMLRGYRPSPEWLRPIWLEGLDPSQTLRNTRGIQPLLTPMRPAMWKRVSASRREAGFTWTAAPVTSFANGPMLIERWYQTFGSAAPKTADDARREGFVSVHANCNVKAFLTAEANSRSFLLHPPAVGDGT